MAPSFVLVVDPSPTTARRVEEALRGSSLSVLAARDATEASAVAEGSDIAVVLSSASLPRGNGYDLARTLRERHPAAAVFLLAGGFEVFNAQRASDAGVLGQIRKPFTVESLRASLEQAIGPLRGNGVGASPTPEMTELGLEQMEPLDEPSSPSPTLPSALPRPSARPPAGDERVATFIPRDYQQLEVVAVDPEVVGPAMERAILEVLPVVVQRLLRHSLSTSPEFRDLVEHAVADAVRTQLRELVEETVRERVREREGRE